MKIQLQLQFEEFTKSRIQTLTFSKQLYLFSNLISCKNCKRQKNCRHSTLCISWTTEGVSLAPPQSTLELMQEVTQNYYKEKIKLKIQMHNTSVKSPKLNYAFCGLNSVVLTSSTIFAVVQFEIFSLQVSPLIHIDFLSSWYQFLQIFCSFSCPLLFRKYLS